MPDPRSNAMTDDQCDETPADTDHAPEEGEEGARRPFLRAVIDLCLNHPTGKKYAPAVFIGFVFLVASAVLQLAAWLNAENRGPAATQNVLPDLGGGADDDESAEPGARVRLVVPNEFTPRGGGGTKGAEEVQVEPPIIIPAPPGPGPDPIAPPMPAKYLTNPAVEADISMNHKDALTSNTELVTRGFGGLPEGAKSWVVRRLRAEAKAYLEAVDAGLVKFEGLGYRGQVLAAGRKEFKRASGQLVQAQGKLKVDMSDADCRWALEALKSGAQSIHTANRGVLRFSPVTLPDFTERLNPGWVRWQQEYGGGQPGGQ